MSDLSLDRESRIYVAGHQTLIGQAMVRVLRENGYTNLLLPGLEEVDLLQGQEVDRYFAACRPQFVFYCAGEAGGIALNSREPGRLMYDNLVKQTAVIHASFVHGVQKLLYFGSSCSYPRDCPRPIREDYLLTGELEASNEAYAVAKIAGMKLCQAYNRQYGTRFISVIPANLYGPGDDFDPGTGHVLAGLIHKFTLAKFRNEPQVTIWGSGQPCRDFLYIDDLARASLLLMQSYEESLPINVGPGTEIAISDLAALIKEVSGYHGTVIYDPSQPDGTMSKLLDCRRIKALGWSPRVSLEEGIRLTCQWFERNLVQEDIQQARKDLIE